MSHALAIRPRNLMWLPAAMLVAWGLLAAAGYGIATPSFGASTGTSTVTATVALDVHIGGTCVGYSNAFGAMPDATESILGSCGITFGTNNGATSTLKVESARTNTGQLMFCRAADNTSNCGTGGFSGPTGANAASLGADRFGVRTTAITTCTSPTWTLNNYNDVRSAFDAPGAGDIICSMTGTTDGNYTLSFRAHPDNVTAGAYTGQANFTVEVT